jgi:anti-anti-sigma regulatory factor
MRGGTPPGIEAPVISDEQPLAYAPSMSRGDAGSHAAPLDRLGILNIAGDLDRAGLDLLRERCRAELAAQVTTLVIDFTGTTDFPSALFRLLAETGGSMRASNGRLRVIGLNEAIESIAGKSPFTVRPPHIRSRGSILGR